MPIIVVDLGSTYLIMGCKKYCTKDKQWPHSIKDLCTIRLILRWFSGNNPTQVEPPTWHPKIQCCSVLPSFVEVPNDYFWKYLSDGDILTHLLTQYYFLEILQKLLETQDSQKWRGCYLKGELTSLGHIRGIWCGVGSDQSSQVILLVLFGLPFLLCFSH